MELELHQSQPIVNIVKLINSLKTHHILLVLLQLQLVLLIMLLMLQEQLKQLAQLVVYIVMILIIGNHQQRKNVLLPLLLVKQDLLQMKLVQLQLLE